MLFSFDLLEIWIIRELLRLPVDDDVMYQQLNTVSRDNNNSLRDECYFALMSGDRQHSDEPLFFIESIDRTVPFWHQPLSRTQLILRNESVMYGCSVKWKLNRLSGVMNFPRNCYFFHWVVGARTMIYFWLFISLRTQHTHFLSFHILHIKRLSVLP